MLCGALILPGFPCLPRWTPLEEWTQSLSNQCAVYWQFGRRGGEMPIHIRIWKPHWLAVLQNPSCALGPGMTFPPPSPLPSPLPRSTTPLQAPSITAPILALQNPYLSLQVSFSWQHSRRFNSPLPSASKFAYQTHPIKVLRKEEDSAVTRNHPHDVCVNINWRNFPRRQYSNTNQNVKYTYLLSLKSHC